MKRNNWPEIIYNVYDYLFREPQHIWKHKNINHRINNIDKAMQHVKNIEVSLNHILNIFFYFLPYDLFYKFIEEVTNKPVWSEKYVLYLDEVEDLIEWVNESTQPDFFFVWDKSNIYIEIKTKSKSSLEQVMKYAFLHIKDCERCNHEKDCTLIFLWDKDFPNLWKEKYQNIEELKKEFNNFELPIKMKKGNVDLVPYNLMIKELVQNMTIWYLNYTDLNNFCLKNIEENKNDDKLVNFFSWLVDDIKKRKLQ